MTQSSRQNDDRQASKAKSGDCCCLASDLRGSLHSLCLTVRANDARLETIAAEFEFTMTDAAADPIGTATPPNMQGR